MEELDEKLNNFKERMEVKKKKEQEEADRAAEKLRQDYLIRTGRIGYRP